jgi:hypothetical protein
LAATFSCGTAAPDERGEESGKLEGRPKPLRSIILFWASEAPLLEDPCRSLGGISMDLEGLEDRA